MAGTTVNEDNIVYKTLQQSINEFGFDVSLEQVLEQGAGKEKLDAIQSVLSFYAGNNDKNLAYKIFRKFLVYLDNAYNTQPLYAQPYAEKIFETLKRKNIYVVLNTGYARVTAELILEKLGWKEGWQYDLLVTAEDVANSRPAPDMIFYAMKKLGISDAKNVVKIGDSTIDIMEGKNAGCALNIGITTGAHTRDQLQTVNPDYILDSLIALIAVIENEEI